MTLNGIPGYAIRSYFAMLSRVRHLDHPSLPVIIQREMSKFKVMGSELLTPEVLTFLGKQAVADLWKRATLVESQLPPCPENEVQDATQTP